MSHDNHEHGGLGGLIVRLDNRMPFILIGVLIGCLGFTQGEHFHIEWVHLAHHPTVHVVVNDYLMWLFFLYLGVELTVGAVVNAGKFAGLATLGGMVVPPALTYLLTNNMYLAIGAAATDVAFSLGASKLYTRGERTILSLLVTALLILAVGDDLGGIIIMGAMYAENVKGEWLAVEAILLVFTYFCGERGVVDFKVQEKEKPETLRHLQWVVEIKAPSFWLILALLNTFVLALAGVHWVLGGCLALIMAPPSVNTAFARVLKPLIPLVLLVFGAVNGAIDLLAPGSWGPLTWGCFVGGMLGKQIGVFSGGMLGRWWSRQSDNPDAYARMPLGQVYGLAVFASVNGTVAIFFVATALSKGYVTPEQAAQATLGYFMTVPAVYLLALLLKPLGIIKDDLAFQPELEDVQESLQHDVNGGTGIKDVPVQNY